MLTINVLSYAANLVFITWGILDLIFRAREKKTEANGLIGVYEMAMRLSETVPGILKNQAADIACAVRSLIFNAKGKERSDIDFESPKPAGKLEIKKSKPGQSKQG